MIKSSFVILPRVGLRQEQAIWHQGVPDWDAFQKKGRIAGIGALQKERHDRLLSKAVERLYQGDSSFFAPILPSVESWRLYPFFRDEAVFLDIETSFSGDVTVVGLFDGKDTKTMIKGINLDAKALKEHLQNYKLIVTFNGASFDLPMLNHYYPGIVPKIPHFDLRYACRRIGLTGGLKRIEREVGIARDAEVVNVVGSDAPMLWRCWKATGDDHYLRLLVKYNDEDTVNLRTLADHVVPLTEKHIKQIHSLSG